MITNMDDNNRLTFSHSEHGARTSGHRHSSKLSTKANCPPNDSQQDKIMHAATLQMQRNI